MGHRLLALVSDHHLDAWLSSVLVDGVATAGLLVLAAYAIRLSLRERRAAARAEASFDPGVALAPGEAVVMGTVERAQGADVAVRIEVEQEGSETESSGVWSHEWSETDRKVRVQPFYLRHASGARVRVEPGEDVMLVDALDGMILVDRTKRVRVAELVPGEQVFAVGELRRAPDPEAPTQGYRGVAQGFLLVPPSHGRRMLLSSEPLGQRFARRAAFHLRWAALAAFAAIAFNAAFAGFHARRWLGETVDVRVTQLREVEDGDTDHHMVTVQQSEGGAVFSDEVSHAAFARLRQGDALKARHVPSWPSASAVGPDVTAHSAAWVALPLLGVLAFAYLIRAHSARPWYEKKVVDQGSGKLPDVEPGAQAAAAKKAPKRPEGRRRETSSG
ncbi:MULTISPECIES: hypothetical protein [Sorangium]|uniref:Uncharacterized protein n=1 Tax=Sorangium cellulosum TaxID=56 RepID=A0A4P2QV08_SORCE|nr:MULTISPECIES: hypothetical protein [Sorangium]AUX34239.1 hypothetical protein SOCE836_064100 [Sorangium cellulosum]WCQ93557.1 hypothetical protein NQZ70_06308 [Sorangium sp. Soce836]